MHERNSYLGTGKKVVVSSKHNVHFRPTVGGGISCEHYVKSKVVPNLLFLTQNAFLTSILFSRYT